MATAATTSAPDSPTPISPAPIEPHPDEDRPAMPDAPHQRFGRQPGEEAADPATDVQQADRPGVRPEVADDDRQQERVRQADRTGRDRRRG